MNITELALYKKLFGGGFGKLEGTAIKADELVEKVYFNIYNTVEETNNAPLKNATKHYNYTD